MNAGVPSNYVSFTLTGWATLHRTDASKTVRPMLTAIKVREPVAEEPEPETPSLMSRIVNWLTK